MIRLHRFEADRGAFRAVLRGTRNKQNGRNDRSTLRFRNKHYLGQVPAVRFSVRSRRNQHAAVVCIRTAVRARPKRNGSSSLLGAVRTAPFPIAVRGTALRRRIPGCMPGKAPRSVADLPRPFSWRTNLGSVKFKVTGSHRFDADYSAALPPSHPEAITPKTRPRRRRQAARAMRRRTCPAGRR
jgi:hypothetical protein